MGWLENYVSSWQQNPVENLATGGAYGVGDVATGHNASEEARRRQVPLPSQQDAEYARNKDLEAGYVKGREIFQDDPKMKEMLATREDLAKGLDGQQLGAMRESGRTAIEGQRSGYLNQLGARAAKAGIGGARAAAMQGAADKGFQANKAENERKMIVDNAGLVRQGQDSLQEFMLRQKYGELGTGIGYAQLGVSDRQNAQANAIANKEPKKGLIGSIFDGIL